MRANELVVGFFSPSLSLVDSKALVYTFLSCVPSISEWRNDPTTLYTFDLHPTFYPEIIRSKGDSRNLSAKGGREGKKKSRCRRREEEQKGDQVGDASRAIG